ncbi:MAG: argininosuccinate synthase [Candidatus Alcyoniella australis]|nr:argininosuccinate synthase [Candidatus Alcyoniella australis]
MSERVVLAYSGGLDTSVIVHWLAEKGYEVIAYMAELGQHEDAQVVRDKALSIGAREVIIEDLRLPFLRDYVYPAFRGGALYEGRYLLGTALARPLIAQRQVAIARKFETTLLGHGSTGKGNDQVRFEMSAMALMPDVRILSPWKEPEFLAQFAGRQELIEYSERHGIPIPVSRSKPYSTDENLLHLSFESGALEDADARPKDDTFQRCVDPRLAPDQETIVEIEFDHGDPVKLSVPADGRSWDDPVELFIELDKLAGANGVGRVDMVENRFVGLKNRGVYETPAGTVIAEARRDLEGITMDREVLHLRDSLIPRYSEMIYYGFWFSPERECLQALIDRAACNVCGSVRVALYKGNATPVGRSSAVSLYDSEMASMDVVGGFDQQDSAGFIKLNALRLRLHALRLDHDGDGK